jgi:hypothetical protein
MLRTRSLRQRTRKAKHTPQAKMMTPHTKRRSPTRGRSEEENMIRLLITLCLSIIITCQALSLTLPYPLARLPVSMGRTITNGSIA